MHYRPYQLFKFGPKQLNIFPPSDPHWRRLVIDVCRIGTPQHVLYAKMSLNLASVVHDDLPHRSSSSFLL